MSKGNTFETEHLEHVLNNADLPLIGDATGLRGSATPGSLYIALHTADVGEAGNQTTNEVAYTSYARVAVTRAGGGWTVASGAASNAAPVTFPACTGGGPVTASHFSVGTAASGTGKVLYKGALNTPLVINTLIAPFFPIGDIDITED